MIKTMRKKLYVTLASVLLIHSLFIYAKNKPQEFASDAITSAEVRGNEIEEHSDKPGKSNGLYEDLNLGSLGLSREAFDYAVQGYDQLLSAGKLNNKNVLSIIDFSKHSSKKRLFVIDMKKEKLLYNTYVSHGRNSGKEMATQFSNLPESNMSSLGFYVTGGTYIGKHGFSLHLFGQEKGINDNAFSRAIVMHSAAYVSEGAIKMQGFIGRSLGCPALPENCYKDVIETVKNGSCLFLYSPDRSYAAKSYIIKKVA